MTVEHKIGAFMNQILTLKEDKRREPIMTHRQPSILKYAIT